MDRASRAKRKAAVRAWFARLVDSTTKVIVFLIMAYNFTVIERIVRGWQCGLEGAPEMLAVAMGENAAVIAFYIWKSKNENLLKLAKPYGVGEEVLKALAGVTDEESEEIAG